MSIETLRVIRCDSCGTRYDWQFDAGESAAQIRRIAADSQWTRRGRKDLCDECSEGEE